MKPPNILIRTDHESDYQIAKKLLESTLQLDTYTIYQANSQTFSKQQWVESCCLLVYECTRNLPCRDEQKVLNKFMTTGNGRVLYHSNIEEDTETKMSLKFVDLRLNDTIHNSHSTEEKSYYKKFINSKSESVAVCLKQRLVNVARNDLVTVLKELGVNIWIEGEELTAATPGCLFCSDPNMKVVELLNVKKNGETLELIGKEMKLCFVNKLNSDNKIVKSDKNEFLVLTNMYAKEQQCNFNWTLYRNKLNTKCFGRNLIYTDIIESTQNVFTKLNVNAVKSNGFMVTARQQTKGKGRSGNQWLSPVGCMMFSMQINISLKSELGQKLSFIQHVVVTAFVKSIKEREGYENLDLNIKWPNDVYIRRSIKIGGVVVNSSCWEGNFKVIIGLGVNVSNEKPTECLNGLIREHNKKNGLNLTEISVEDALVGTMNNIECLVDLFQDEGMEKFAEEYYRHWMHSNAEVALECQNNEKATIIGLNEFGYLRVKLQNGDLLSLQPDGNSFDMMRNMIILKK